ncbi:MAG: hypothetical protein ACLGQH_09880, partial [Acidobacteriota bacterium]
LRLRKIEIRADGIVEKAFTAVHNFWARPKTQAAGGLAPAPKNTRFFWLCGNCNFIQYVAL